MVYTMYGMRHGFFTLLPFLLAIVSAPTRAEVEARKHKLGVIPDLLLGPEKRLVDIKTVCAKKYYRPGLIRGAAGSGEGRRKRKREDSPRQTPLTKTYGSPVDERALSHISS